MANDQKKVICRLGMRPNVVIYQKEKKIKKENLAKMCPFLFYYFLSNFLLTNYSSVNVCPTYIFLMESFSRRKIRRQMYIALFYFVMRAFSDEIFVGKSVSFIFYFFIGSFTDDYFVSKRHFIFNF